MNETFAGEFGSSWRGLRDSRAGLDRKGPSPVSDLLLLVTVFGVTFVAELPDKSLFASLVLGTRYRPVQVPDLSSYHCHDIDLGDEGGSRHDRLFRRGRRFPTDWGV